MKNVYKYGSHPTPGLIEVRCYAAALTFFLAEGLQVSFQRSTAFWTARSGGILVGRRETWA